MKANQKLKNRLEELERKAKDIGTRSLELISHHHANFGKDEEWDMAVNINHEVHKVYNEIRELKKLED